MCGVHAHGNTLALHWLPLHILLVTLHVCRDLDELKTCAYVRFTVCMGSYCEISLAREKVSTRGDCAGAKLILHQVERESFSRSRSVSVFQLIAVHKQSCHIGQVDAVYA